MTKNIFYIVYVNKNLNQVISKEFNIYLKNVYILQIYFKKIAGKNKIIEIWLISFFMRFK